MHTFNQWISHSFEFHCTDSCTLIRQWQGSKKLPWLNVHASRPQPSSSSGSAGLMGSKASIQGSENQKGNLGLGHLIARVSPHPCPLITKPPIGMTSISNGLTFWSTHLGKIEWSAKCQLLLSACNTRLTRHVQVFQAYKLSWVLNLNFGRHWLLLGRWLEKPNLRFPRVQGCWSI